MFSSFLVSGQNREINIENSKSEEASFWYQLKTRLSSQIELDSVQNSAYRWHIRIWTNIQAIDVYELPNGEQIGQITSWTTEYVPSNEEPTNRIYFEHKPLGPEQIELLVTLIDSSNIYDIPDQGGIANWYQGNDGVTYIIETSNIENYFFKTYWTPLSQDSLKEAVDVHNFISRCSLISESDKVWADFSSRIPFANFTDGSTIGCRPLSKWERMKLKKERKRYRQQNQPKELIR